MKKLDWKDKKILKELDLNARKGFSEISKNIHISKQVIKYRVDHLTKNNIIKNFITYIDVQALGYTFYDVFFKIKHISKKEKERIECKISKLPSVGWFVSTRGEWNLVVCMMAKTPVHFNNSLNNVLNILGERVMDYNFFIVIDAFQLPYKRVLGNYNLKNFKPPSLGKRLKINLRKNDLKILKNLAINCRIPIIELAEKTKMSIDQVRYSIKKMENQGIIQAYKPLLNVGKLGLLWNIMLIQINKCKEEEIREFLNFLKNIEQVFYIVRGVGNWNLMVEFHTKEIKEIDDIKDKISLKFSNIILDEKIIQVIKEHKCLFIPEDIV